MARVQIPYLAPFILIKEGAIMGKAKHKPRPSVPRHVWLDRDGCWLCKNPNNCNRCKLNKQFIKEHSFKIKGRH